MSDEKRPTIAENERSPASDAADDVPFGPPGTTEEDRDRQEPGGTAEAAEPKTDDAGEPIVPPARQHH